LAWPLEIYGAKELDSMTIRAIASVLLFLLPSISNSESIVYEIYETSRIGDKLIAKGSRTYSPSDIEVFPYERSGKQITEKLLELEQGYRIGARVFFEEKLTGFGVIAQRTDNDFSWNWYNRRGPSRFEKQLGGTIVEVRVTGQPFMEELIEVKFLEDNNLRFKSAGTSDYTHRILVKAGSVLRFK
jgi:hypothetical protein